MKDFNKYDIKSNKYEIDESDRDIRQELIMKLESISDEELMQLIDELNNTNYKKFK